MTPVDRLTRAAAIVLVTAVGAIAIPNFYNQIQRSKQKQTMATIRDAAMLIESGHKLPTLHDGWGHSLQIRFTGRHYSIRAAGADGRFESTPPRGSVTKFEDDLVFADGTYAQYDEQL